MIKGSKCYGSTTVGERGQIVVPAEARQELGLDPGDKLLVFGRPAPGMLFIVKADQVADLVTKTGEWLSLLKETIDKEAADE